MKRYQLIGRKRASTKISTPNYPLLHLHSFPLEIILTIFDHFAHDSAQLLRLSLVCQKFRSIINKYYLYRALEFDNSKSFTKFCSVHLPNSAKKKFGISETSSTVNLVQRFVYYKPPVQESDQYSIAGTYSVEGLQRPQTITYNEFCSGLTLLIKEDFNLKSIELCEISPSFLFPAIHPDSFLKKYKQRRTLNKLVLKAQSGWSIPFKLNHLSLFLSTYDTIGTLELHNFTIDEHKLSQIKSPKKVSVENLVLSSCTLVNRMTKRTSCELFDAVAYLELDSMGHRADLSLIDFIKLNNRLSVLSIDIGSSFFYENDSFNFSNYNAFFKLLCSKQGSYANIKSLTLKNFDLFFRYDHAHETQADRKDVLSDLLGYLATLDEVIFVFKKLPNTIRTCKNCGFTKSEQSKDLTTLSQSDWKVLLRPMSAANIIKVYNYQHRLLFEKSSEDYFD